MLQEIIFFFLPFILFSILYILSKKATNNKNWRDDLKVFPEIKVKDNQIEIKNVRNFKYGKDEYDYIEGYKHYKFKLEDIEKLDYILEPFMFKERIAHPLLSFTLKNNKRIVLSVEVRKVKGEDYFLPKTFLRYYELFYVIATEEDVIKLRTHMRHDPVYLFPIQADKKFIENLFLDMITRAKNLQKQPEFYHPIFNSCTTNLIDHANKFLDKNNKIPKIAKTIIPGYTKGLLFDFHYVFHGKSHFKDFNYYKINEKSLKCTKNFSDCIRE